MLGIAVLFFLGLWVIITIIAMVVGSKFGRKPATKLLGAFLGFMLTMGGFVVYWTIEYIQIQRTVTHLCKTEGGITVYVTPEQWRQQIGEAEWAKLTSYTWEKQSSYSKSKILFNGKEYESFAQHKSRIIVYATYEKVEKNTLGSYSLYYDSKINIPLFSMNSFDVGTGAIANTLDGLKFWINSIIDCGYNSFIDEKNILLNQYSNIGDDDEQ